LRNTGYKIIDSVIQEVAKPSDNPKPLFSSLELLETKCVYEMVFKNSMG
jgi:hypothetical protein